MSRVVSIILGLALSSAAAAKPVRVTTTTQLRTALARLHRTKVSKIPSVIYKRDGYTRRQDWMTAYRVTPTQRDLVLVGNKTVGDFISPEFRFLDSWLYRSLKVPREGDVYLLLDRRLPLKLLHIVRELEARGHSPDEFFIISAHRTERVNRHIHNYRLRTWGKTSVARRSLHLVGRAMDLIIGDLTQDGRVDVSDHRAMICAIRRVERRHPKLAGGLGLYAKSIHTDIRSGGSAKGRRPTWCGKGGNKGPLCGNRPRCRR